jgi:hypothetical protein
VRPITLKVHGDFWDSHIYRGRLYLWDMDSSVHIFNWNGFVDSVAEATRQPLLKIAFAQGDSLYHDFLSGALTQDEEILHLVRRKLESLADLDLDFDLPDLERFRLAHQDSPFGILHDDLVIFRNTAYALTEHGFFSSRIHTPKRKRYRIQQAEKIWCGRGVNLSASRSGLAIAAASDGLFEYSEWRHDEPIQVSTGHASFTNWLFASIYASSAIGGGYLAGYRWIREDDGTWRRDSVGILPEHVVFDQVDDGSGLLTWGSQEKLYSAGADSIRAVRFTQKHLWEMDLHSPFQSIGEFPIRNGSSPHGKPVSAGVSFFGSIVEYPEELYIVESDFSVHHIRGAATRWRVFPRSHWYPNHLHVVLEDRLEMLSINGDLFSDQRGKISGIEFQEKMLGEL